jgi:hypothetical protein
MRAVLLLAALAAWFSCSGPGGSTGDQVASRKLAAPDGALYIGQTEVVDGDIATLERVTGRKVAITQGYPKGLLRGTEEAGALSFDVEKARSAWDRGYLVMVGAYEPGHFLEGGMVVDRLLRGAYDEHLEQLAEEFRRFGEPMIFTTGREPNIIFERTKGGYGPDGMDDRNYGGSTTSAFTPPSDDLFAGLGDAEADDGYERWAAAHRYYYDFFVNRQGLDFLSFDSSGWNVIERTEEDLFFHQFETFFRMLGDAYVDVISVDWYIHDTTVAEFERFYEAYIRPRVGKRPVLLPELGICRVTAREDGDVVDYRDSSVRPVFESLLSKPAIGGFVLWGSALEPGELDCLLGPGHGGEDLKAIIADHRSRFLSCARFGEGTAMAGCEQANSP